MMTPSLFQAPPVTLGDDKLPIVWGGPPEMSIFLSFPSDANPMNRLSKDQKGGVGVTTSVPDSSFTSSESRARIHMRFTLLGPTAAKATHRPSGDTAGAVTLVKVRFSGTGICNRAGRAAGEVSRKRRKASAAAATKNSAAATGHSPLHCTGALPGVSSMR